MRDILHIIVLCAALFTSCREVGTTPDTEPLYTPRYAKGFTIERDKANSTRYLVVKNPWQGADNITLFYPINTPAQRIVAMSSSYVAMLDAIGCTERIVGVSGAQFISTPRAVERIGRGEIADVGFDGAFDFERISAMKSDLVLLYGISSEDKGISNKLKELHIPYIYIGEYLESEPLGKTEWVVALGYLCGREEEARALFAETESRYLAIRDKAHSTTHRPLVMLNTPYRDAWFMPPTESYMVRLIEEANGEYVLSGKRKTENGKLSTQSTPISLEEALLLAKRADFWLNVGHHRSLEGLRMATPLFGDVPAVRNQRVYNNTRRNTPNGGSDFWESGAVKPDVILADLVTILHGDTTHKEELYYYEQLQ
jgi:iron complex transport system substrate-binding protein